MDDKFFFHHIRRTNGTIDKQIDICDTLDAAKKAYRTFLGTYAYNARQDTDFVSAMISTKTGVLRQYTETWGNAAGKFFMHRIKHDKSKEGAAQFDKGIEVKDSYEAAKQSFNSYLGAYAYDADSDIDFVSCMITDGYGAEMMADPWAVSEPQPEPEVV